MNRSLLISAVVATLTLSATPVAAQDYTVTAGAGLAVEPAYPGADHLSLLPLPVVFLRRTGEPITFRSPDQSFGFRLLGKRTGFSAGPVLGFTSRRDEDDVGAPVGNVGFTFEPGVYVQAYVAPNWRLRGEVRHGIGGHDAFLGNIGADYVQRGENDRFIASVGPRLRLADERFERRYFGVDPSHAVASGLPAFHPDGGIYAVGAVAGLFYQFTPEWGAYGFAGYDRLVGDAADSPVVRRYGSRDQASAGLALTYTFGVHR